MYLGCRALVAVANTHTYRCVGRDIRYPQPECCDALAKDSEAGPSMKLNPGHRGGLGSIQIHCCPIGKEVLSSVPAAMGTPILLGVGCVRIASSRHMANLGRKPFLGAIYTRHHLNPHGCLGGVFPHRFV